MDIPEKERENGSVESDVTLWRSRPRTREHFFQKIGQVCHRLQVKIDILTQPKLLNPYGVF